MSKIIETLKEKNIAVGWLYAYIHFITEIICFYYLTKLTSGSMIIWVIPFVYDALAFVPQSIIGYISDKYPKINIGIIGVILLFISYIIFGLTNMNMYLSLVLLCLGNCCLHIAGAENTLRTSDGRLSPPAIFVAGGSFGVVTGRLLARSTINPLWLLIPIISITGQRVLNNITTLSYPGPKNIGTKLSATPIIPKHIPTPIKRI